jgi:hypothetical protein
MDISQANCCGCGRVMRITQVRCPQCDVSMEGEFEISPFSRLPLEDQLFVAAFVRHHGSIKKMEGLFGISYPTVKNRLKAIGRRIDENFEAPSPNSRILEQLSRGQITVDEALDRISGSGRAGGSGFPCRCFCSGRCFSPALS